MPHYTDLSSQPRHQTARLVEYPPRRSEDVSREPRTLVYAKESSVSRRYHDDDRGRKGALIIRDRPHHAREVSPEDVHAHGPRGTAIVVRPRSASRVRLVEPALEIVDSSSDDDRRRPRRERDDTRIRATSRPGKRNDYAFVRHSSKKRRKSEARPVVVRDLELKTDRGHKDFKDRRDDLENREAAVLVRARSRDRGTYVDDGSDIDVYYEGRRRRSSHDGGHRRRRGSIDNGGGAVVLARDVGDRGGRRKSAHDAKRYLVADDESELRSPRHAPRTSRVNISPDRETVDSSSVGNVRLANALSDRNQKHRLPRVYNDSIAGSEVRGDLRRDSAYHTDTERRAKDREREAIDRERRAIDREQVALDREKALVDREKRGRGAPAGRDPPDDRRQSAGDYLKQGDKYIKDGQKYHKTGQGLLSELKNFKLG